MSQKKVDEYKKKKANREKIMKKKNWFSDWRSSPQLWWDLPLYAGSAILFTTEWQRTRRMWWKKR